MTLHIFKINYSRIFFTMTTTHLNRISLKAILAYFQLSFLIISLNKKLFSFLSDKRNHLLQLSFLYVKIYLLFTLCEFTLQDTSMMLTDDMFAECTLYNVKIGAMSQWDKVRRVRGDFGDFLLQRYSGAWKGYLENC